MQIDFTDELIQDDQPAQAVSRPTRKSHHRKHRTDAQRRRAKARPPERTPDIQNVAVEHDDDELWDREETCAYFGGGIAKPINVSTLYRGIDKKIYPSPVNVSLNVVRWIPRECREARHKMIEQRGKLPKPNRGRPRKQPIT